MNIGPKIQLKQTQKLMMTPQLRQAIQILQLSQHELLQLVKKELEENPVIEESEESEDIVDDDFYYADTKFSEVYSKYDERREKEDLIREDIEASPETLANYLEKQLRYTDLNELSKRVGRFLIGNINEDGFLEIHDEEDFVATRFYELLLTEGYRSKELKNTYHHVLKVIQTFDPIGVGARSLREYLLIQVLHRGYSIEDTVYRVIDEHWKSLTKHDFRSIAKKLKLTSPELEQIYKTIISLRLIPAGNFLRPEESPHVTPDASLIKLGSKFKIIINDRYLPKFSVNAMYSSMCKSPHNDGSLTNEYINEKIASANWLMKSIEQRQQTIFKVVRSIVKFQKDFFEKGELFLKPLVLKDVADDIGVHESTVSRITSNKYLDTDRGLYALKYFFSSGISQADGRCISSKRIKTLLTLLIQNENNHRPLTDAILAKKIKLKFNTNVARRTVAKYRESLGILPSNKRKTITIEFR